MIVRQVDRRSGDIVIRPFCCYGSPAVRPAPRCKRISLFRRFTRAEWGVFTKAIMARCRFMIGHRRSLPVSAFDDLYRPAFLKIDRAKYHISDLDRRISSFLAQKPFELLVVHDEHAGKRTYEVRTRQAIPDELSLILGDSVHNLRSALDVTLFAMIGDKARRPWVVQFPFARTTDELGAAIAKAELALAGKHVVDVVEAAKPFPGGNDLLHSLNALDIADKHRLIITTARNAPLSADDFAKIDPFLPVRGPGIIVFSGEENVIFEIAVPRLARRVRRAGRGCAPIIHKPDIQPAFQIAFGSREPFAGQALVPILEKMTAEVEKLCGRLCKAFLR